MFYYCFKIKKTCREYVHCKLAGYRAAVKPTLKCMMGERDKEAHDVCLLGFCTFLPGLWF